MPAPSPITKPSRSLIPRAAGFFRVVITRGECAHGGKSADAHGRDGRFGAAGDHHVSIVVLDDAEGISDGMGAGGAGGGRRLVRSLGAEAHGDLAGGKVDDRGRNKERRNLARAAFEQSGVFAFDNVESADAGTDVDAYALVVLRSDFQSRHLHRFIRCSDGEVDEARHLLDFFFLDIVQRVEVLDFGGDLAGEGAGVETGDASDAALAREHGLPHFIGGIAHAADQAEPRNYDPASQLFPRFPCLPM